MMMLPGWLTEALQLVGYEWPSTNESMLISWGDQWGSLSQQVSTFVSQVEGGVQYIANNNAGPATEALVGYMRGDSNLTALGDFGQASSLLSQICYIGSGIVILLKAAVIAQLAILAAAIATAVVTAGLGSGVAIAAREVARRLINAALNIAVKEITGG